MIRSVTATGTDVVTWFMGRFDRLDATTTARCVMIRPSQSCIHRKQGCVSHTEKEHRGVNIVDWAGRNDKTMNGRIIEMEYNGLNGNWT